MTSILKKFKKTLETYDALIYDEYKSLEKNGILDKIEGRYSRKRIEREIQAAESDREALMDVMEANGKLIDLLNEIEEAEAYENA